MNYYWEIIAEQSQLPVRLAECNHALKLPS